MRINQILRVLTPEIQERVSKCGFKRGVLPTAELRRLEQVLFEIQDELEYDRRRKGVCQDLNDIRNVLLDELGVNQTHPGMSYPHVERMRRRINR